MNKNTTTKYFIFTSLLFITAFHSIFSYDPPGNEKPFVETFKLNEYPERQNVIKFMNVGLLISFHCVIEKQKKYFRRNCGAWKPMDVLESGKYKKYFLPNKVLPDVNNLKSVSFFICKESGGSITTEVNEFGGGRDVTPLDFCQFSDKSLLAISSIEKYIRGIPNFQQTVIFD